MTARNVIVMIRVDSRGVLHVESPSGNSYICPTADDLERAVRDALDDPDLPEVAESTRQDKVEILVEDLARPVVGKQFSALLSRMVVHHGPEFVRRWRSR